MKRVSLVAAATLMLTVSSFALASAEDAAKAAPAAETKAAPAAAKPSGEKAGADKAIAAIDAQITAAKVNKSAAGWKTHLPMPKAVAFDPAKKYLVRMETSEGTVVIKMLPASAPMHVTNFLYLTRLGFYDGIVFHRVIPNFMAQGGCPLGTGTGGPGYGFGGEFTGPEKHDRPGMLSMANTGMPNTDGSQFFLTFVATPWLNGKHTIFGEVTEGLDVLKKLEANGSPSGATKKRMAILKCTVEVV